MDASVATCKVNQTKHSLRESFPIRGYCKKVRASDMRKETRERRVKKENPSRLPSRLASLATRITTGGYSVTIRAVTLAFYYTLVLVSLISLMT